MSDVEALKAHMTRMEILKGDTLVRRGGRNTDIYIIVDGIWRASYVNSDGNDITLWFASKGDLLFSSWCFVGNMPSMIALEAMSDGVVYGISRSDAEDFFMSSVEAARIGRRLYEKEIFEIERWLLSSGAPRARERYETLLDEKAELLQHVPLKYIASYLFITPQSLSRIRAEMARGRKKRH
jgi:CRP-like cAMP-binding protein